MPSERIKYHILKISTTRVILKSKPKEAKKVTNKCFNCGKKESGFVLKNEKSNSTTETNLEANSSTLEW